MIDLLKTCSGLSWFIKQVRPTSERQRWVYNSSDESYSQDNTTTCPNLWLAPIRQSWHAGAATIPLDARILLGYQLQHP